jgi:MarR family transcriptional regulator, transcriptional regulator for hemolysin
MDLDVLSTPGHLISLAARGFARLSEARLKPLGIERTPDPADGRSRRITLTEAARARLPDAIAVLLRGNHEVLSDFTGEEAGLLVALLTRLIAGLDRVASVEASPGAPTSEKGD